MSIISTKQSHDTSTSFEKKETVTSDSQVLESENTRPDTPILSSLEVAVLEHKKIAFYIPVDSDDYKESVQILLNWCTERLQKSNP